MSEHIGRGTVFWSGQTVRAEQTPDGPRLDLLEKGPSRAPFPDHGWNQERLRYNNSKKLSLKSPAGAVDVPYIHLFTTTTTRLLSLLLDLIVELPPSCGVECESKERRAVK